MVDIVTTSFLIAKVWRFPRFLSFILNIYVNFSKHNQKFKWRLLGGEIVDIVFNFFKISKFNRLMSDWQSKKPRKPELLVYLRMIWNCWKKSWEWCLYFQWKSLPYLRLITLLLYLLPLNWNFEEQCILVPDHVG